MVVNPSLGTRTVPEFIAHARAHPGDVNMGLGGSGGVDHVAGALFQRDTGTRLQFVSYRGLTPDIRAGKLQALAVTSAVRAEALPDVPTVAESVPGLEASQWYGIVVPKGTPAEIVDRLNKEINAGLADPKMKARLAELGGMVLAGSPSDFAKLIADETEKWGKVIRVANIKPE
jgi:tripartite-type tricarboxylate transporter receptor subunit TctC